MTTGMPRRTKSRNSKYWPTLDKSDLMGSRAPYATEPYRTEQCHNNTQQVEKQRGSSKETRSLVCAMCSRSLTHNHHELHILLVLVAVLRRSKMLGLFEHAALRQQTHEISPGRRAMHQSRRQRLKEDTRIKRRNNQHSISNAVQCNGMCAVACVL